MARGVGGVKQRKEKQQEEEEEEEQEGGEEVVTWRRVEVSSGASAGAVVQPRSGHAVVAVGKDVLLVFAGSVEHDDGDLLNDVARVTFSHASTSTSGDDRFMRSARWECLQAKCSYSPRKYHTATLIRREIWLVGGSNKERLFADVHVLNLDTMQWSTPQLTGNAVGIARTAHGAVVHPTIANAILIYGGYGGTTPAKHDYMSDLVLLRTDTRTLEVIPPPAGHSPCGRAYHTFTRVGTNCIAFGGRTPTAQGCHLGQLCRGPNLLRQVLVYDSLEGIWRPVKLSGKGPTPRSNPAAAAVGDCFVILGGRQAVPMPMRLNDMWLLRGASSSTLWTDSVQWQQLDATAILSTERRTSGKEAVRRDVLKGRSAHSLTATGPSLLLFGGYCGNSVSSDELLFLPRVPGAICLRDLAVDDSAPVADMSEGWQRKKRPRSSVGVAEALARANPARIASGVQILQQERATIVINNAHEPINGHARARTSSAHKAALPLEPTNQAVDDANAKAAKLEAELSVVLQKLREKVLLESSADMVADGCIQAYSCMACHLMQSILSFGTKQSQLVDDLQASKLSLQRELGTFKAKVSELRTTEEMWLTASEEAKKQKAIAQEHLCELQISERRRQLVEQNLADKTSALATCEQRLEEERARTAAELKEKESFAASLQRAEADMKRLVEVQERERDALTKAVEAKGRVAEHLEAELASTRQSANGLQETVARLSAHLERLESRIEAAARDTTTLRATADAAAADRDRHAQRAENAERVAARAEAELAQARTALVEARSRVESMQGEERRLEAELTRARAEIERYRTAAAEAESGNRELSAFAREMLALSGKVHSLAERNERTRTPPAPR
eukprot:jgi/Chlat1/3239/Chrsp22S03428